MSRIFSLAAASIILISLAYCKEKEKNEDENLALLLLLSSSSQSGPSGCPLTYQGVTTYYPATTASTTQQSVSVSPFNNTTSSIGFTIAKGLTVGQKVLFTEMGGSSPGSNKGSTCKLDISNPSATATSNSDLSYVYNGTANTVTYTVLIAGDYFFLHTVNTGVVPKVVIQN